MVLRGFSGGFPGVFRGRTLYEPDIFPISSLLTHRVGVGFMQASCRVRPRKTPGKPLPNPRHHSEKGMGIFFPDG